MSVYFPFDDKYNFLHCKQWMFCLVAFFCLANNLPAQCISYKLSDRGDTLNCIDKNGVKQGPWLEVVAELRGNPGYEDEGVYKNGKKEGLWRRYSLQGDVISMENYSWGLKNGKSQYFSILGIEREESWWAIDPKQKFDTLEVPDLYVDGNYRTVIVPNEGRSMKHGTWIVYDPLTGRIQQTEEYLRDSAVGVLGSMGISNVKTKEASGEVPQPKKVEKPAVVQEWEKKNSGKKKVVVRDGSTGY